MNESFCEPLVDTATGGQRGGGATVTELGFEVLRRYRAMEEKATASVSKELAKFAQLMTGFGQYNIFFDNLTALGINRQFL